MKQKNIVAQFNTKLKSEVIKEDLGFMTKHKQIIPEQEEHQRELMTDAVPKEKKIHAKTNFNR